jgi:two-component system, OmpR family, sensor histidine kinase PhoQ
MPLVHSLRAKVLLWVSVALIVLFAVTIFGIDLSMQRSTNDAVSDLLETQLLGLIGRAQETRDFDLTLPENTNMQFSLPDTGPYGILWDADGVPVWTSISLVGRNFSVPSWPDSGMPIFFDIDTPELHNLRAMVQTVTWEFGDGHSLPYTFGVAVALDPYDARQARFRRNLIGWFVGITLTMLAVLTGLLSFVLRPVHRLERQVREVEAGARGKLTVTLPTELVGLAGNLNALIDTERRRLIRYRNTLDDLAHSLKTPLAAMRTLLSERRNGGSDEALRHEIDRMDQRVSHQLRRARASGATGIGVEPVRVDEIVSDIVETLDKVYRDKQVSCELDIDPAATFQGEAGDLSELVGNLIENAYKYCRRRVDVRATAGRERVVLRVGDDGPGIEPDEVELLLQRGKRADESIPGQGIGLAVVQETVELYNGELTFGRSPLGGAEVRVELARAGVAV